MDKTLETDFSTFLSHMSTDVTAHPRGLPSPKPSGHLISHYAASYTLASSPKTPLPWHVDSFPGALARINLPHIFTCSAHTEPSPLTSVGRSCSPAGAGAEEGMGRRRLRMVNPGHILLRQELDCLGSN